jgi:hypothetical protein
MFLVFEYTALDRDEARCADAPITAVCRKRWRASRRAAPTDTEGSLRGGSGSETIRVERWRR